ncbi:hypothetical protein C5167_005378, partial [Papaver somniferum]
IIEVMGLKRKKQHEGSSNMVRGEDRISRLPDPLLHHILSSFHSRTSYVPIDIDAPSLEVFQHKGTLAEVYDLHSFPSLIDANISLSDINDWIDEDENIATNLLVHLFNVKRLVAGSCFLGALSHVDDDVFYELPSFDKLTCLEVVWNSPDLGIDARLCGEDNGWKLTRVPECLLSHLRVLEFRQFSGDQRELGASSYKCFQGPQIASNCCGVKCIPSVAQDEEQAEAYAALEAFKWPRMWE